MGTWGHCHSTPVFSWPLEPCVLPSSGLICPSGPHNSAACISLDLSFPPQPEYCRLPPPLSAWALHSFLTWLRPSQATARQCQALCPDLPPALTSLASHLSIASWAPACHWCFLCINQGPIWGQVFRASCPALCCPGR